MPHQCLTIVAELPEPEIIDAAAVKRDIETGATDLVVVLGPTASGKTRYAVKLARELNALFGEPKVEILSADSRQVYVGMDIGTGKDLSEYGEIPYHLIDIAPAGSRYNVYQYQADFAREYADILSRGCVPLLCGGTGLYIEAAALGYDFGKDRPVAEGLLLPRKPYFIGTLVSREERVARIDARLKARLEEGMVEEVKGLLESGIPAEDLIYYGLEYKFVTQYVMGILTYEEMFTLLSNAIHQFAKRQMTWFRGMERDGKIIHWTEV